MLKFITMPKQVIVQSSLEAVEIIDTPIPTPREKEVVIKVVVSGTNPKDWKYPLWYVLVSVVGFGRPVATRACLCSAQEEPAPQQR